MPRSPHPDNKSKPRATPVRGFHIYCTTGGAKWQPFKELKAKKASVIWHKSEPDSEFVEFSGAGHIVNMDTPEQFNKVLKRVIR